MADLSSRFIYEKAIGSCPSNLQQSTPTKIEGSCEGSSKSTSSLKDLTTFSEETFFSAVKDDFTSKLKCDVANINTTLNVDTRIKYEEDLRLKIAAIRDLKKQVNSKTNEFQIANGRINKNPNAPINAANESHKKYAQKLNSQIKNLNSQIEIITGSIPFSEFSDISDFITNTTDSELQDKVRFSLKLEKTLKEASKNIQKQISSLQKMSPPFAGEFKESIVQNSEIMGHYFGENGKNLRQDPFLCSLDAKYGKGAVLRDQALDAASIALGFGAGGVLVKTSSSLATKGLQALRSTSFLTLGVPTLTLSGLQIAKDIRQSCGENAAAFSLQSSKGSKCQKFDIQESLEKNNCALSIGLNSLSVASGASLMSPGIKLLTKNLTSKSKLSREIHHQKIQDLFSTGQIDAALKYENNLKNMMSSQKMKDLGPVGKGVSQSRFVEFPDGTKGIWKPDHVIGQPGTPDEWHMFGGKSEVLAYELDRYLEFNRVPTTIEKEFNGTKGTVQVLVGDLKDFNYKRPAHPEDLILFDYLIQNPDRKIANYLVTNDGRTVAIDHGHSFQGVSGPDFQQDFMATIKYDEIMKKTAEKESSSKKTGSFFARNLPPISYENEHNKTLQKLNMYIGTKDSYLKLKNTSTDQWKQKLRPYLNDEEINSFLKRKNNIILLVEQAQKMYGDAVFKSGPASNLEIYK